MTRSISFGKAVLITIAAIAVAAFAVAWGQSAFARINNPGSGGSSAVTSVTGTWPVISSGGTTPAISLGFSTSTAIANTQVLVGTAVNTFASYSGFTYANTGSLLTVTNASTTNLSSSAGAWFATAGGSVGIGTASPDVQLQVSNGSSGTIDIGPTGGEGRIYSDSSATYMGSYSNIPLILRTNNAERVRIDTSGNVGISTSTPNAKLDVRGAAYSECVALTDGATITIDWSLGNCFWVTLGGSRTVAFSNVIVGQAIKVFVTQGTSYTLTYPAAVHFVGGAPTLSTAAGTTDKLVFETATSTATVMGSAVIGY